MCSCLLFFSQLLSTFSVVSLFQMNEMFMYFSSKKKKKKKNKYAKIKYMFRLDY